MTLITMPPETPAAGRAFRELGRLVAAIRLVLASTGALAAAAGRVLVALARWFAADPRRSRTAVAGVCLAAACGAVIGLAVGVVTDRVVALVLDAIAVDR